MQFLLSANGWPYLLTPFIPIAVLLELAHASAGLIFGASALGIVPTAALMGLRHRGARGALGPGIGGLLNVTFGNAPELIIALFALGAGPSRGRQGLDDRLDHRQHPARAGRGDVRRRPGPRTAGLRAHRGASVQASMLLLAAAALVMPAIFELVEGKGLPAPGAELVNYGVDRRAPLARGRRSS